MAYKKCEFKDGETVITAECLNAMQDAICQLETDLDNHNEANNPHNLDAEVVGAVPKTRKVNNKELSKDITLDADDLGARPNTWLPTIAEIGAAPANLKTVNAPQMNSVDLLATAEDLSICPLNAVTFFRTYKPKNSPLAEGHGDNDFYVMVKRINIESYIRIEIESVTNASRYVIEKINNIWGSWLNCSASAFAPSWCGMGGTATKSFSLDTIDSCFDCGVYSYYTQGTFINGIRFNYAWLEVSTMQPNSHSVQRLYPILSNTYLIRYHNGTTWGEWMCDNPPMELGVEYCTTERWNGKAVYTQMRSGLSLPNTSYRDIEFGIPNDSKVIRYRHIAYGPDMCEFPMVSGTTVQAYGYFAKADSGLIYRYKTSTDLTSYTESYIQVWYTKE